MVVPDGSGDAFDAAMLPDGTRTSGVIDLLAVSFLAPGRDLPAGPQALFVRLGDLHEIAARDCAPKKTPLP